MAAKSSPFPSSPQNRSPFPRKSLPQPGESLQEAAFDLVFDKFVVSASIAATIAMVAMHGWVMRWLNIPVSPWLWTYGAVFMAALAAWQYYRMQPQLAALRLGIRGEREVGRALEEMRALGYVVFHDIPGNGFNVDHALIGPGGVFAVETKTISKPLGRRAEVDYDGERVVIDGHVPDRDPLAQAQASAAHLRDLLQRMAARDVDIRPVVLYPGWYVSPQPRNARVWVLNLKALRSFLQHEPSKLSPEDIALFADRLTVHLSAE